MADQPSAAPAAPSLHVDIGTLLHALLPLWPLFAITVLVLAGRALWWFWQLRRLSRSGIHEVDEMDGPTFEHRLALLFRDLGYRAEIVGSASGDFGADLVVTKDGRREVVQAKCWRKTVGVKAVQEAVAARGYYSADAAIVVTNSRFSKPARTLAGANDVGLRDRDELVRMLLLSSNPSAVPLRSFEPARATLAESGSGVYCARCGSPVSPKVTDFCLQRRDRFAGLVYCFEHQGAVRRARS
jgi:restriction system protein